MTICTCAHMKGLGLNQPLEKQKGKVISTKNPPVPLAGLILLHCNLVVMQLEDSIILSTDQSWIDYAVSNCWDNWCSQQQQSEDWGSVDWWSGPMPFPTASLQLRALQLGPAMHEYPLF